MFLHGARRRHVERHVRRVQRLIRRLVVVLVAATRVQVLQARRQLFVEIHSLRVRYLLGRKRRAAVTVVQQGRVFRVDLRRAQLAQFVNADEKADVRVLRTNRRQVDLRRDSFQYLRENFNRLSSVKIDSTRAFPPYQHTFNESSSNFSRSSSSILPRENIIISMACREKTENNRNSNAFRLFPRAPQLRAHLLWRTLRPR